ncbi:MULTISPECIES: nucleotide sugar dehydrogenase [unclassified Prochlorococcus]|uniref:nucleotide sugar dehydrogenase n=1 Tax=unclassified Prochlorococcus TaxID=2627481 RepID=UPI00097CC3ED|nr:MULTISPECIES: nucleotide sugar dehydrogenase [unclassified Prochlorococcus]AQL29775.1 UDP-glucose 6-dehydrogenase [Prochlorococcus sp. RS50]AQL31594.1 UDP-glucose 6-dehydrogenase [Prochlorococcus sp. RS01]AQL34546.1 UDP-glucose 6-dehydrogenase [Prochlorococcus sp. RS04]
MDIPIKKICCIGAGYVGGPTMAVMSLKCPDICINVVDVNKERIDAWNSDDLSKLPVFEPGLAEIVGKTRGKNLIFSTRIKESVENADMIFISVNTPTKTKGIGAGKASDLKWVEASAREVAKFAKGHTIVVEKSTLPVRTAEVIQKILYSAEKNSGVLKKSFKVLSNPEFLAEGTAINDLLNPDRVLIGGDDKQAMLGLSEIYKEWVPEDKILLTNIWSSELAKLTSNAFLAQRISSINSISAICEVTGADVREVSRAIGKDSRIGSKFLNSGPGFGGSCFKKDILNLVYLAEYFGLTEVANFWESVVEINNWHQKRISEIIVKKLFGTVANKKLIILGFAFKANTNDTRESAAINICKNLLNEGANLLIYDPKVSASQIKNDLKINPTKSLVNENTSSNKDTGSWEHIKSIHNHQIFKNAYATIILTEWEEFKNLNWTVIAKQMVPPAWVFDSRSIVNIQEVRDAGLSLWRLGDGVGD